MPEIPTIPPRTKIIPRGAAADHSIDYAGAMLRDARAATLERLAGLTVAELDWAPGGDWNTTGALLSHLIAMDKYFRLKFIEGREPGASEKRRWVPGLLMGKYRPRLKGKTLEDYLGAMAEGRALLLDALEGITAEAFYEQRADNYAPEGYNVAWTMYHLVEDESHHRGQITMLRKLYAGRNAPEL